MLRLGAAARRLRIHPLTLRRWADTGGIEVAWVGRERRLPISAVDAAVDALRSDSGESRPSGESRVASYVRVSGTTGQESSLEAQEAELRARFGTRLVAVYQDRGSGLLESRRGLERVLKDSEEGRFEVLAVTHADRLARFGTTWLELLLLRDGVKVEVLHERGAAGGLPELLDDFMSLVTTFSGRMYGILSAEAKRSLPASAGSQGLAEQRREGQVPEASSQALCESSASSTERIIRHRPRGEPLGRGFPRNVYGSPVRPYGDWGPGREGTPSLRIVSCSEKLPEFALWK